MLGRRSASATRTPRRQWLHGRATFLRASYEQLHRLLKKEGVVYAGQAGLYHSIFRIANIGAIADADLARLLGVFRKRFGA